MFFLYSIHIYMCVRVCMYVPLNTHLTERKAGGRLIASWHGCTKSQMQRSDFHFHFNAFKVAPWSLFQVMT